jgi:hypothetical protein
MHNKWVDEDHPGCQLSGHLLLDRVPGNFHIQARSNQHDIAPHMTNVSHIVNSLFFGDPMAQVRIQKNQANVPPDVSPKISPMDGNVYPTYNLHEAYHHYLKVVATSVEGLTVGKRDLRVFQVIENSQLAFYTNDVSDVRNALVLQKAFPFLLSPHLFHPHI